MKLETIHRDKRGTISLLTGLGSYPEVTVFTTRKGFARGGCIHRNSSETCCVIEGLVEYHIGDTTYFMNVGDVYCIDPSTPHYFIAIQDSVVMEWGPEPEEKKEKDAKFRAIVDEINYGKVH